MGADDVDDETADTAAEVRDDLAAEIGRLTRSAFKRVRALKQAERT